MESNDKKAPKEKSALRKLIEGDQPTEPTRKPVGISTPETRERMRLYDLRIEIENLIDKLVPMEFDDPSLTQWHSEQIAHFASILGLKPAKAIKESKDRIRRGAYIKMENEIHNPKS